MLLFFRSASCCAFWRWLLFTFSFNNSQHYGSVRRRTGKEVVIRDDAAAPDAPEGDGDGEDTQDDAAVASATVGDSTPPFDGSVGDEMPEKKELVVVPTSPPSRLETAVDAES